MTQKDNYKLSEVLIHSFVMIDGDLELVLREISGASSPDQTLSNCAFKMIHRPSGAEAGTLNLRVGYTQNVTQYRGNIGYIVFEAYRGQHYSSRSCSLLVPLLKKIQFSPIWFTCNIDNIPSRKSIERVGALYVDTTVVPDYYKFIQFYPSEARKKLRFRWDVR